MVVFGGLRNWGGFFYKGLDNLEGEGGLIFYFLEWISSGDKG